MTKWDSVFQRKLEVEFPDLWVEKTLSSYSSRNLKLLDLGCGTGRHSLLARKLGFEVTAVDTSIIGLQMLKRRAESLGRGITIVDADLAALPFPDDAFDIILCTRVLHHGRLAEIKAWLRELERVLTVNGTLLLIVLSINDARSKTGVEIERNTRMNIPDTYDPEVPHHFFSEEELRRLLKNYALISLQERYSDVSRNQEYGRMLYYYVLAVFTGKK